MFNSALKSYKFANDDIKKVVKNSLKVFFHNIRLKSVGTKRYGGLKDTRDVIYG